MFKTCVMKLFSLLGFLFLLSISIGAQSTETSTKRIQSVVDSTVADNMVLVQTFVVNASVEAVWHAYTTAEGWTKWATPVAEIDFRLGGLIQTSYDKDAKIGDPGTIRLHVVSYVPHRMLTLQAELSENFPEFMREDVSNMYNMVYFEELDESTVQITSYGIGYKHTPKYLELLEFFISGNEYSYMNLISYLETGKSIKF